jgi:hypothetical protein
VCQIGELGSQGAQRGDVHGDRCRHTGDARQFGRLVLEVIHKAGADTS